MGRAFGPRHSQRRTHQASAREKSPNSRHEREARATIPALARLRGLRGEREKVRDYHAVDRSNRHELPARVAFLASSF